MMNKNGWLIVAVGLQIGGCASAPQKAPGEPGVAASSAAPAASAYEHDEDEDAPEHKLTAGSEPAFTVGPNGLLLLQALLPVPDPAPPGDFPKATVNDKECIASVGLTGQLDKDLGALVASCGANTGMKEYSKQYAGTFDASHRFDTFQVKLAGGYCYRFFAMADGSVEKMEIRVHRTNGALQAAVQSKQPVVLYKPGEPWCRRRDRDVQIVVGAIGGGQGHYSLGIWARPNPKGRAQPR